ncbi:MAG: hypothetical protein ACPKQO_09335 [Nitrososphaeraceae archaeon]
MISNNYPMREWHIQNMENNIVKYLTGIPENASNWEKRRYKKYGGLNKVYSRIQYDIKHGVKNEEVVSFLEKIKVNSEFADLRMTDGYSERLSEIETKFNETGLINNGRELEKILSQRKTI